MHFSHQHLSDSYDRPTGVIHGVLNTIHNLRESVSKKLVVVWDHGIPVLNAAKPHNWRESFLDGYKATRIHNNEEWPKIVSQLKPLHDAINMLGYSNRAVMGLEADDTIGILAHEIPGDILILSTDKDFYQLLSNRVSILAPKKSGGKFLTITQSGVEKEFGIPIQLWSRYLALGGDKSDNIKPMKGMGPKTALKLVKAGVSPYLEWEDQPEDFRAKNEKYKPVWRAIQRSYMAADLPHTRKDFRFAGASLDFSSLDGSATQGWLDKQLSKHNFEKFCAVYGLNSLLSLSGSFFTGEQPCPALRNVIPTPLPVSKMRTPLV